MQAKLQYKPNDEHPELRCPTCGKPAVLLPASSIYTQTSFTIEGLFWACKDYPKCNAYVGCHDGSDVPLGTLADRPTREERKLAHKLLHQLCYKKQIKDKIDWVEARRAGYLWLAHQLNISTAECHIGRMDAAMCQRVTGICMRYLGPKKQPAQGSLEV